MRSESNISLFLILFQCLCFKLNDPLHDDPKLLKTKSHLLCMFLILNLIKNGSINVLPRALLLELSWSAYKLNHIIVLFSFNF